MYSYQHITNRNEFIQQFREDQGLDKALRRQNSRINTVQSSKSRGNSSVNVSKCYSNANSRAEGRWDYLHKLEQLKRLKLEDQRKSKEQYLYEKDLEECTFSPKLNKEKSYSNLLSLNNLSTNNVPRTKTSNSNGNSILPNNEKNNESLLERQKMWEYKRNMKIENIKYDQNLKDTAECVFVPKLNSPNVLKKIEIGKNAKTLVVDPESFLTYITRQNKHRSEIEFENKREKSLPGSGNIWVNKPTKPKEFNLITESNGNNKLFKIKALSKPVALNKFNKVKNNYRVGDGRVEKKNNLKINDLVYSTKVKNTFEEIELKSQNGIKFEKVEFGYAIKNLHDELHSIDLMGFEN